VRKQHRLFLHQGLDPLEAAPLLQRVVAVEVGGLRKGMRHIALRADEHPAAGDGDHRQRAELKSEMPADPVDRVVPARRLDDGIIDAGDEIEFGLGPDVHRHPPSLLCAGPDAIALRRTPMVKASGSLRGRG